MKPKIRSGHQRIKKISKTLIKILYETFGSIKDIKILSKEDEIKLRFSERLFVYEKQFIYSINKKIS